MSDNMLDLSGWVQTSCATADAIRFCEAVAPASSLTDLDGQYGDPLIYTEWAIRSSETPVLRDYRWPNVDCKHYVPAPTDPAQPEQEGTQR